MQIIFYFVFVLKRVISDRFHCFTIDYTDFIWVECRYATSELMSLQVHREALQSRTHRRVCSFDMLAAGGV